jgi:hypothetical protein
MILKVEHIDGLNVSISGDEETMAMLDELGNYVGLAPASPATAKVEALPLPSMSFGASADAPLPAPQQGGQYLVCDNARRSVELMKQDERGNQIKFKCSNTVRYEEFEETMLNNLSKLRPENVLPNADEHATQAKLLRDAIAGLAGELIDIEKKVENFTDQVGLTPERSIRERFQKRIMDLERRRADVEGEKAQKETALSELERGAQDFEKWQANLAGLKKALVNNVDTRIRLKAHLKEFIANVEVFGNGHECNVEHAEALLEDTELARAKSYPAFRRYMTKRFLSPDGRFYRLFLKTSRPASEKPLITKNGRPYTQTSRSIHGLEIAPISSISFRCITTPGKSGVEFSGPKLDVLFKEFFDGRKQGFVPKASVL